MQGQTAVYNVQDFGASGNKHESGQAAVQQTIDACAAAGGGTVYFPPGVYTCGTLHLRSHVRIYIDSGAVVCASKDPASFDKNALFYGEDLENITLQGRGTLDGQAEYEWRLNDTLDHNIYQNQLQAEAAGVPLLRPYPTADSKGHLILLLRCSDVRIADLSLIRSPGWTIHPFACQRLVIDGITIRSSMQEGVWADGIDPDGCKDVHITNCTIETGDDAIVFYSSDIYGPPQPCENITVTNCRLSSASSALKFCDVNYNAIRNVTIDNCVISDSNRGVAFMVFMGGELENVVLSNLTIDCRRFDWFWWGDGDPLHFNLIQLSDRDAGIDKFKQPPVGRIRNVLIRNVVAHGKGTSILHGRQDSPLENITLENIQLFLSHDSEAHPRKSEQIIQVENVRNFQLRDVQLFWETPYSDQWRHALVVENAQDLILDGVTARQPASVDETTRAAIVLENVSNGWVKDCLAQEGTLTFFHIKGKQTRHILLQNNATRSAVIPVKISPKVKRGELRKKP